MILLKLFLKLNNLYYILPDFGAMFIHGDPVGILKAALTFKNIKEERNIRSFNKIILYQFII